ncbi:hypothetical protein LRS13_14285 [Svornostia abyssi]|uniref:Uncharacterized protein n=1 Tax=Svornostia abyssi TaxID=2898438 RepID=A0ABY5PBA9_9ACTN|nr:hypothetical protein LRS13_14285 [Parviterribacteraceae bacterium J379]
METATLAMAPTRPRLIAGVLALGLFAASCGSEEPEERGDRPPTPIVVNAAILDEQLAVSPTKFGAGPIRLVVTNQTRGSKELRLETAGQDAGLRQRTGPINPSDTASLQADLPEGEYTVTVGDGQRATSATLAVGPERPNSNNDLLQP